MWSSAIRGRTVGLFRPLAITCYGWGRACGGAALHGLSLCGRASHQRAIASRVGVVEESLRDRSRSIMAVRRRCALNTSIRDWPRRLMTSSFFTSHHHYWSSLTTDLHTIILVYEAFSSQCRHKDYNPGFCKRSESIDPYPRGL